MKNFKNVWINYSEKKIGVGDIEIKLTRKEYKIVDYLSKHAGQIFSKENIYENVWGYDEDGDAGVAVTEHVKRIRKKMESLMGKENSDFIETVWGVGYRWKK